MSAAKMLQQQARQIESDLSTPGLSAETVAELAEWWAEIGIALAEDGGAIDDPRSALEIAMDLDDAEVMATRQSDYPR
jgi:hypothetical protein